jgi:hypothetical protein
MKIKSTRKDRSQHRKHGSGSPELPYLLVLSSAYGVRPCPYFRSSLSVFIVSPLVPTHPVRSVGHTHKAYSLRGSTRYFVPVRITEFVPVRIAADRPCPYCRAPSILSIYIYIYIYTHDHCVIHPHVLYATYAHTVAQPLCYAYSI